MLRRGMLRAAVRPRARGFVGRRHAADGVPPTGGDDLVEKFAAAVEKDPSVAAQVYEKLSEKRQTTVAMAWRLGDVEKEFAKADINKDGSVSVAEFKQWIHELRWGAAEEEKVTNRQLLYVYLRGFVPFVAFGVVDNGLMILAGDVIDARLGSLFAMSVMASAALGNAFSNLVGAALKGVIEEASGRLGIPDPHLTLKQLQDQRVKWVKAISGMLGVFVGCLIGMLPLLFIDTEARRKEKEGH
eukprot:Hpha_TRINITY_DN15916_c3_g2::TRINITY_DN15916_c3_g2_i1::g.72727::m.72727